MPKRLEQIPIALDQLVNTVCGGWADETDHCESAYLSEKNRLQCPPALR